MRPMSLLQADKPGWKAVRHAIRLPVLLTMLLFHQGIAAAEPMAWKVRELIQAPMDSIELRDQRGWAIRTLEVRQLVYLYAVMSAIEEAAEIAAELYVTAGDNPNAFAGQGKDGENIVGINFGMLDLIGNDVHAAAAILGHELAHQKLNHGADLKKAQTLPSGSVFSAAQTKYSRDNEREADYLGMIWAIEAGYDPEGAVRVHERLYQLSKTQGGSFGGSHPSSIERITVLKSLVRRLSP